MFAGFLRITFSAPQILAASTVFFLPNSRNEEMMVMVSFGATAGLFWTVNVFVEHIPISRASAVASSIFSWCYSRCFLKFAEIKRWKIKQTLKQKSWNFILLIFINVCQVRWIVIVFPGLTMSIGLTGNFSLRECPGIIKTMVSSAYTYCIMPTPRCWHGRNRTLWFSVERFV